MAAPMQLPNIHRTLELPVPVLHSIIAHVLDTCVAANDLLPTKGIITRFHAKERPPFELQAYLTRCVPSCLCRSGASSRYRSGSRPTLPSR
jgi:hypothetical protein